MDVSLNREVRGHIFYLKQTKSVKSSESVFNNKWKNLYSIINEYGFI